MQNKENKPTIIGIQGGRGSFNEQALKDYVSRHKLKNYKVKYLYVTENVLRELEKGTIDYGQFAIHNSVGGVVDESLCAIAHHNFEIVEQFAIKISHHLMKRRDVDSEKIYAVLTHDQVLKQCAETLQTKYPNLKKDAGTGLLTDNAKIAEYLAKGKIDKNTYYLGPEILSKIYDLEIVDRDLQDSKNNLTSFLIVKRYAGAN